MQLGRIDSGHDADMHHVTECMHDHAHFKKQEGPLKTGGDGFESQAMEMMQKEQEGQFSLSAWLNRIWGSGKRFLHGFWNGGSSLDSGEGDGKADLLKPLASEGEPADRSGASSQNMTQPDTSGALHAPGIAAASAAVPPPRMMEDNPYFSAVVDAERKQDHLWQRVRVRFREARGELAEHLPGRFFNARNRDSFRAKQEKPREDLRKRSRFHGDDLDIDCILTDDSYLLDSYDRKGEYSRLSAKK